MQVYAYDAFKGGLSQRLKIKVYAKEHDIDIRHIFSDKTPYDKNGINSLFEAMEKSDIKTILVHSIQSLWNDEELHFLVVTKLLSISASVISVSEPSYSIYTDNINTNGSIADYLYMLYSSLSSAHLAKARRTKALSGDKPCGIAPYGYMWNEYKEMVINETEADTLKLIFKTYIQLSSLSKLENFLMKGGYFNRNNKPFKKGSLSKILKNDFYIGYITYQGQQIRGNHTPLIEADDFFNVNKLLAQNVKNTKI